MNPSQPARWVGEGLVTGFIGYATVVVLFALANLVAGEGAFHTPALLGSVLFFGARTTEELVAGPAPILAYNGVHLLAALLIGLGAAWLVSQAERRPALWYLVFFLFLAGFVYSVLIMGVLAAEIGHVLSWQVVVLANLGAGLTSGLYLWSRHATLLTRLKQGG